MIFAYLCQRDHYHYLFNEVLNFVAGPRVYHLLSSRGNCLYTFWLSELDHHFPGEQWPWCLWWQNYIKSSGSECGHQHNHTHNPCGTKSCHIQPPLPDRPNFCFHGISTKPVFISASCVHLKHCEHHKSTEKIYGSDHGQTLTLSFNDSVQGMTKCLGKGPNFERPWPLELPNLGGKPQQNPGVFHIYGWYSIWIIYG